MSVQRNPFTIPCHGQFAGGPIALQGFGVGYKERYRFWGAQPKKKPSWLCFRLRGIAFEGVLSFLGRFARFLWRLDAQQNPLRSGARQEAGRPDHGRGSSEVALYGPIAAPAPPRPARRRAPLRPAASHCCALPFRLPRRALPHPAPPCHAT